MAKGIDSQHADETRVSVYNQGGAEAIRPSAREYHRHSVEARGSSLHSAR